MSFFDYLRKRAALLVCSGFLLSVFVITFLLYSLPLQALAYILSICIAFLIVFIVFDFARQKKRAELIKDICSLSEITLEDILRLPEDCELRELAEIISAEKNRAEAASLEKYNDMIDYYTVWVHQIKTPIASMRLNLQNEDSPLARRQLSELLRIEQYVDMVLAFLRVDSDYSDFVFRETDVDALIRKTVKRFAGDFIGKKIKLDLKPTEMNVVTDEKWFGFVLEQLLSNSLKYTDRGSVSFYGEDGTLVIEDTGIGIEKEDLPRIFQKGFTGVNGRTDRKSSGIGLYLVGKVCRKIGIEIKIESEVGAGTRVLLSFPGRAEPND